MRYKGLLLGIASLVVYAFSSTNIIAAESNLTTLAEESIRKYASSIYQVRIINDDSKSQKSLGSGFFIGDGSYIATNYHVVSSVVLEPEENHAVIDLDGKEYSLKVIAIDVIHDLAILGSAHLDEQEPLSGPPISLSRNTPALGARLYSIGNPLDIGLTIVEGNYNGLVDNRFFDQIHFSGAINSGMSGGPTLNRNGEVVGINVASAGNQVGFLVPVDKLITLYEQLDDQLEEQLEEQLEDQPSKHQQTITETEETDTNPSPTIKTTKLQQSIGKQIQSATHTMIDLILSNTWPKEELGSAMVLGKVHKAVDCWGNSDTDSKTHITQIDKGCNSRDGIYISHRLRSGYIEYEFSFHKAENWPSTSFYNRASNSFSMAGPGNRAGGKDVDNYNCLHKIVQSEETAIKRKMVYCTRPYTIFPGLFDTFYMAVSLDHDSEVIMEHFTLSGVNKDDADRFLNRFINQVEWNQVEAQ